MQEEGNPKNFTVVERYESKDVSFIPQPSCHDSPL